MFLFFLEPPTTKSYQLFKQKLTWKQAYDSCKRINGNLAVMENDSDVQSAFKAKEGLTPWIGIYREVCCLKIFSVFV